jgi:hypothetical protein
MAITITTADVKRKAMIPSSETGYDSAIASLITEMQAPLEYSVADVYLNDTTNTNLQATLKLGILEMITGEFLEQLRRELGSSEEFSVAGVSIGASVQRGVDIIQQGAARLAPFLKGALPMMSDAVATSTTVDQDTEFTVDEEVW